MQQEHRVAYAPLCTVLVEDMPVEEEILVESVAATVELWVDWSGVMLMALRALWGELEAVLLDARQVA